MREQGVDPRLQAVMADAARNIALYRDLWASAGTGAGLHGARLLDKSVLRAAGMEDRVDSTRRRRKLTTELSSGSSGEPMTTYSDREALRARRLAFLRALVACGWRPWQKLLLLTGRRGPGERLLGRWHYASIGDDTAHIARRAGDIRPQVLYGPLSTLELLAQHAREHRLPQASLRLVISTAEQLTADRQRSLERAFGVPVADFYGMAEFGLVAYRRPGARSYTRARDSLVLEFLPLAHDHAVERLVVTDLAERTCPLIRYDTGDLVRRDAASPERPLVEFAGRDVDCILMPDGARVSPYRIDLALEKLPGLEAFEVVQQPDLSVDVTIDAAAGAAEGLRSVIAGKLALIFGHAIPCRVAAGTIRRAPAGGKFRPIRSLAGARA